MSNRWENGKNCIFYFVFRWGSPITSQLQDKTPLSSILISEGDIMQQHFAPVPPNAKLVPILMLMES